MTFVWQMNVQISMQISFVDVRAVQIVRVPAEAGVKSTFLNLQRRRKKSMHCLLYKLFVSVHVKFDLFPFPAPSCSLIKWNASVVAGGADKIQSEFMTWIKNIVTRKRRKTDGEEEQQFRVEACSLKGGTGFTFLEVARVLMSFIIIVNQLRRSAGTLLTSEASAARLPHFR